MDSTFLRDGRFVLHSLRANRTFTAAALAALALGLGANTAIFSVVDAVMFCPLPYRDAARLVVVVWSTPRNLDPRQFEDPKAVAAIRHWQSLGDSFACCAEHYHRRPPVRSAAMASPVQPK